MRNNAYIKPPKISMNFSENKVEMKKRFQNILQDKNKKMGIVALSIALVLVIFLGGIVAINYIQTSNNENIEFLSMSDRKKYFIDFAMNYRIDFIPEFDENTYDADKPVSSEDFLMLTYYMNRNNLPEDLNMSANLVEEVMKNNFGIEKVEHHSQRKGWTYIPEENKYTPYPEGTAENVIFDVVGLNTYVKENKKIYDVMLREYGFPFKGMESKDMYDDLYNYAKDGEGIYVENVKFLLDKKEKELKNGEMSPYDALYDLVINSDTSGFTVGNTIRIKYYIDKESGKPRFIFKREGMSDKVFPERYDEIVYEKYPDDQYSTKFALIRKGNYWGVINLQNGQEILNPDTLKLDNILLNTYEEVWPIIEVEKDGLCGAIDYYGNMVVKPEWKRLEMDVYNAPNEVFVYNGEKWGGMKLSYDRYNNVYDYEGIKVGKVDYNVQLPKEISD